MSDYQDPKLYEPLPPHMRYGAMMWVLHGVKSRPGDFLFAVMCNDLMQACARADDINRACLFDWAVWLNCYAPPESYGSIARARAWKGVLHERVGTDTASDDHLRSGEQSTNS